MAFYALTKSPNIFVGVTVVSAYDLGLVGVTVHEIEGTIPDLNRYTWDFDSDQFVKSRAVYSALEFQLKFTLAERVVILQSTDPVVIDIVQMLNIAKYINILDSVTQQSVEYLADVGIIQQTRITEILS